MQNCCKFPQILPPCTCSKSGKHSPSSSGSAGCGGGVGGTVGTMASSKSSGVSSAASEPFYLHIPPASSSASSTDDSGGGGATAASDGKQRVYLTFSSSVVSGSSDRGAIQYVARLADLPKFLPSAP